MDSKEVNYLQDVTLTEQDDIRLFYLFAYHVFKIQQYLKCSICFEVFNDPIALPNCIHSFCKDCILMHLENSTITEPPCPICNKPILRGGLQPHHSLITTTEFVTYARSQIEMILGSYMDVTEFPSFQKVVEIIKKNGDIKEMLTKNNVTVKFMPLSDDNLIFKGHEVKMSSNKLLFAKSVNTSVHKQINSHVQSAAKNSAKHKPAVSATNKDLFDILKQSPAQNPLFKHNQLICSTKTYSAQKQNRQSNTEQNIKYVDKVYRFENNANKIDILRWLHDSRNRFDFVPQLEENNLADSQHSEFDMPSVSQRYPHKFINKPQFTQINKQKLEQNRIRLKNKAMIRLSRSDFAKNRCETKSKRTRSLDCYIKTIEPKPMLKRHSITGGESYDENIIIEQVNSEEEEAVAFAGVFKNPQGKAAVVELIEEECLKNIEKEVFQGTIENKPSTSSTKPLNSLNSPKRSKRISLKKLQTEEGKKKSKNNMNTSSGWTRMKQIKKTISKTEKKPIKLTVVSHQSSFNTLASTANENIKNLKVLGKNKGKTATSLKAGVSAVVTKQDSIVSSVANKSNVENKPLAFDLDTVESYFNKNIDMLAAKNSLPQLQNNSAENKLDNSDRAKSKNSSSNKNMPCNSQLVNKKKSTILTSHQELKEKTVLKANSVNSNETNQIARAETSKSKNNSSSRNLKEIYAIEGKSVNNSKEKNIVKSEIEKKRSRNAKDISLLELQSVSSSDKTKTAILDITQSHNNSRKNIEGKNAPKTKLVGSSEDIAKAEINQSKTSSSENVKGRNSSATNLLISSKENDIAEPEIIQSQNNSSARNVKEQEQLFSSTSASKIDEAKTESRLFSTTNRSQKIKIANSINGQGLENKNSMGLNRIEIPKTNTKYNDCANNHTKEKNNLLTSDFPAEVADDSKRTIPSPSDTLKTNYSKQATKTKCKLSVSSIIADEVEMEISEFDKNESKNYAVNLLKERRSKTSFRNGSQKETLETTNCKQVSDTVGKQIMNANNQNVKDASSSHEKKTKTSRNNSDLNFNYNRSILNEEDSIENIKNEILHTKKDVCKILTSKDNSKTVLEKKLLYSKKDDVIVNKITSDVDKDDIVFIKPTQSLSMKNQSLEKNSDTDDDDIFILPTQIIAEPEINKAKAIIASEELKSTLKNKLQTLADILKTFVNNMSKNSRESWEQKKSITNMLSSVHTVVRDIKNTADITNDASENAFPLDYSIKLPSLSETTRTVQIQTEHSSETSSLFSHSVTTQTETTHAVNKHAAIQTDSLDQSKGFQISSNAMFNIQPVTDIQMQTEKLMCPKCSYAFVNNSKNKMNTNILVSNASTIKNLSQKYSLTGSFDNIEFQTQDIIKGKHIDNTSYLLKNSNNSQNVSRSGTKNDTKENASLLKSNASTVVEKCLDIAPQVNVKLDAKKTFKRIRQPSSDSDSDSDVLPKGIKRNKYMQDDLSIHFASGTSKHINHLNNQQTQEDGFQLSEGSQDINYVEYLEKVIKKYDEENHQKGTLSTTVTVEKPPEPPAKRSKTQDIIKECEMIIKEACTNTIRIEHTENYSNNLNNSRRENIPEPSKLTLAALQEEFQQNFGDDVEDDINTVVNINKEKYKKLASTDTDIPSDAGILIHNDILSQSKTTKDKFSDSLFASGDQFVKSDEINYIKNSNLVSSIDNKNMELLIQKNSEQYVVGNQKPTKQHLDEIINQFNNLNDSFEEDINAEVESINKSAQENKNRTVVNLESYENIRPKSLCFSNDKIVILQDIIINKDNYADVNKSNISAKNRTITENKSQSQENLNMSVDGNGSTKIFDSDEDVVETTPQKNRSSLEKLPCYSQAYFNPEEKMVLPPLIDESPDVVCSVEPSPMSCLNQTFLPPPEFQDFCENDPDMENMNNELMVKENRKDEEVIKNITLISSLTPELLLPQSSQINKHVKTNKPFITSTPHTKHSQIVSIGSLNLSPIQARESNPRLNPILAAQHSKFSPLTVVKTTTPPPQKMQLLNTSTPKQKSILNYVRPSEKLNTSFTHRSQTSQKCVKELSQINKKPCVACTRMSKEQLLAITTLSNKKLISYSNSFSASVTHMIVVVNEHQCVKDHTMKYVSAIASGIWVISFSWIEECLKQGRLLPEEPFEVLDITGIPGPKQSRLTRTNNPLLQRYMIYAAPPFLSTTQKEVENVVLLLGGEVVPRPDDLLRTSDKICLIIAEAHDCHDYELYETWLETLKVVTVDLEWLSKSVGQYQTLSIRPFSLYIDESICDLGYPSQLVADAVYPFSSAVTTTL